MMKIKIIFQVFFLFIFLVSCQGTKDVLTGKTPNSKGEEFLVEKKNPLVVPPDFEDLPVPNQDSKLAEENIESDNDFQKLLEKENKVDSTNTNSSSTSTEESILKKIKNKQ